MSMFAPWKLTWISSGPAILLVFDWLSTLVPAAPFSSAGSVGDSAATDGVDAGMLASGLTAGAGLVAAGVLVVAVSAAAFFSAFGCVSWAGTGAARRPANTRQIRPKGAFI